MGRSWAYCDLRSASPSPPWAIEKNKCTQIARNSKSKATTFALFNANNVLANAGARFVTPTHRNRRAEVEIVLGAVKERVDAERARPRRRIHATAAATVTGERRLGHTGANVVQVRGEALTAVGPTSN